MNAIVGLLNVNLGVISIETDQVVQTQAADAGPAPSYLTDTTPVSYYGTTVWRGYVTQPGNQLILTDKTHATYNTAGANVIVAVIDTGVDTTHPVLKNSLVTGYDFTRGKSGGSETADVTQSTVAVLDHRQPAKSANRRLRSLTSHPLRCWTVRSMPLSVTEPWCPASFTWWLRKRRSCR